MTKEQRVTKEKAKELVLQAQDTGHYDAANRQIYATLALVYELRALRLELER